MSETELNKGKLVLVGEGLDALRNEAKGRVTVADIFKHESDRIEDKGILNGQGRYQFSVTDDILVEIFREEYIYERQEYMEIGNKLYRILRWDLQGDTDGHFAFVTENDDGIIDFFTMHYNGACGLDEILEDYLS